MKKIIVSFSILSLIIATSCSTDGISSDTSPVETIHAGNFDRMFDISNDNSGLVKIIPIGEGITSSEISFGHGTDGQVTVFGGGFATHKYPEGNYTVSIKSIDAAGNQTTNEFPLQIIYRAPINIDPTFNFAGTTLNLTAKATYANGMQVIWGDGGSSQVPTNMTGALGGVFTAPSHTYAPGVYTVTVIALSGGVATTTATFPITVFAPFGLPVTYENPTQNYGVGGTFGGVNVAVVANPFPGGINTSASVWKFTKTNGAETWGGTYTPIALPNGVPVNINNGNKFKVMVYSTEVGKQLHFQLEQGSGGFPNTGIDVASTVANQWEELVFDFGSAGIPAGTTFDQIVFQYNLSGSGTGEVIYIDNVTQSN